jgi:hypothetical protein
MLNLRLETAHCSSKHRSGTPITTTKTHCMTLPTMTAHTHLMNRQSETTLRTKFDPAASQVLWMSNTARYAAAFRVAIRRDATLLAQFPREIQAIIILGHQYICQPVKPSEVVTTRSQCTCAVSIRHCRPSPKRMRITSARDNCNVHNEAGATNHQF